MPWRPKVNDKYGSVSNNDLHKTQPAVAMEKNIDNYDLVLKDVNIKIQKKKY